MTNCRCQGIACETEDRERFEARGLARLRGDAPSHISATRRRRLPNFARNLSWSFFETPQKHCNSNDANSMIEQAAGELRAKLMGSGGAWPGLEPTHPATLQRHSAAGVKGAGGICRGAGGRRRGLAGLRGDAPSEARSADGSRAGRRPPAHTAAGASGARNISGATSNNQGKQKPQIPKDLRFHRARGGS